MSKKGVRTIVHISQEHYDLMLDWQSWVKKTTGKKPNRQESIDKVFALAEDGLKENIKMIRDKYIQDLTSE